MPSYIVKCCCGADGAFETTSLDAFVRGGVTDAYRRWMSQHDDCPELYAKPKEPAYGGEGAGPFADLRVPDAAPAPPDCPHPASHRQAPNADAQLCGICKQHRVRIHGPVWSEWRPGAEAFDFLPGVCQSEPKA